MHIYKKVLRIEREQNVGIPQDAIIISAHTQYNKPTIWYLISEPDAPIEERLIYVIPTGHDTAKDVLDGSRFIGTCLLDEGQLVVHIFEGPRI